MTTTAVAQRVAVAARDDAARAIAYADTGREMAGGGDGETAAEAMLPMCGL